MHALNKKFGAVCGTLFLLTVVLVPGAKASECDYAAQLSSLTDSIRDCSGVARLVACIPEHQNIAKALFEPEIVHLEIRSSVMNAGVLIPELTVEIWFSAGELYVRTDDASVANYSTVGDKLYEWNAGSSVGRILKRNCGDTLRYLLYLVDASELKAAVFRHYRSDSGKFDVVIQTDGIQVLPKKRKGAWLGMKYEEAPFWLRSLYFWDAGVDGDYKVIDVSRPTPVRVLPAELKILPQIIFERSKETLLNRMEYL
ncbi:MAG: hypothetical protein GY697_26250 [Desulfobacterales bacterium]|nr:hypothetical protein [Desulfobacterales bacterium]